MADRLQKLLSEKSSRRLEYHWLYPFAMSQFLDERLSAGVFEITRRANTAKIRKTQGIASQAEQIPLSRRRRLRGGPVVGVASASAIQPKTQKWEPEPSDGRHPGAEFGNRRLATGRQGADHEDINARAALCSAKDGAQDQGQARPREVGHSEGASARGSNGAAICGAAFNDAPNAPSHCVAETTLG